MAELTDIQPQSRFIVGIDLGTTNSALAYVDALDATPAVHDFPIPQFTAPGLIESRATLASFHYELAPGEFAPGSLRLPFSPEADPKFVVGAMARDYGADRPGRLVVSAKSWLSHSGVDRTAGLLPWHGSADVERLSPVDVSARYLTHLRLAWDAKFPEHPLAEQDVVLGAPASFDEVARELTIAAARAAGLSRVVLLEEPQAAFYSWIAAGGQHWDQFVRPGQKILVCDVGGGTSDFTLIRVKPASQGRVLFHRVAVGEHLILGGDNLDLALAHYVETKINRQLEPRSWALLVRACRVAKETLLSAEAPQRYVVNVGSGGSKLIGGAQQVELSRNEVRQVFIEGFLPAASLDEKPAARRSGFQQFGLPYAADPAITRHLAAFLSAHRRDALQLMDASAQDHDPARPDLVLFNGGLFESPVLRDRLLDVLSGWFSKPDAPWRAEVLKNERLDLAVARGGAYYGLVRRGKGVRISGGLAHSYFLGVDPGEGERGRERDVAITAAQTTPISSTSPVSLRFSPSPNLPFSSSPPLPTSSGSAICLLPAGVEEGQTIDLTARTFALRIREPVEFPLYVSSTRTTDPPGAIVPIDPEQMTSLPPIRTVLQSGRKSAGESVAVRLHGKLTEIGTLEIWCSEVHGDRTWRLQFDVRAASQAGAARHIAAGEAEGVVDDALIIAADRAIRAVFTRGGVARPDALVKRIEQEIGILRNEWPSTLMRAMWQTLLEVEPGRRISDVHEARWLNLIGYCLRPGYGMAVDDWRVLQMWKLQAAGVIHPKNEAVRAEWWVLWRRVAGGMSAGQQRMAAEPLLADWRTWFRKGGSNVRGRTPQFQFGPHESAEVWRLLGALELLPVATKLEIGQMLFDRLSRPGAASLRDAYWFALGRIGARVPVYGPINCQLPAETAEAWAKRIVETGEADERASFALMLLCRKTGDRYRDISQEVRDQVLRWLLARNASSHVIDLVCDVGALEAEEQKHVFGETLPKGLRIE